MDADAWDDRYRDTELMWSAGPNAFVEQLCRDLPPGRSIDLAAGEGRNAIWLARRGWSVTGLDFSPVAVERARRLAGDLPVDLHVGDALTAELPTVDLVLLAYLQLPADQRRQVVRRAFLALETGGTLLVVAHDSSNLAEGTGGPQDAAVLYTAGDVLADLQGTDPLVVRAGRVAREVMADDGHGGATSHTAWDCLTRVVRR